MELLERYKKQILIGIIVVICLLGIVERLGLFQSNNSLDTHPQNDLSAAKKAAVHQNSQEATIAVYVSGEVKRPGVYVLPKASRVGDALALAGGFSSSACTNEINLAAKIKDGQQVNFPSKKEMRDASQGSTNGDGGEPNSSGTGGQSSESSKVNINTANQSELETLTGIGPATAQKIIAYRNQHNKFTSLNDLKNISGIGDKKVEALLGEATVQ